MKYEWDSRIDLHVKDRISREHADRQQHTATEILRRLRDQPGVILADEVGMGKTFVALGAAMSVALSDPENRPVVVMVPPSLKEKWPTDFAVFRDFCLPLKLRGHIRHASADHAIGFLKLLDDPASRKVQIVFLTHGAMNRSMGDPWVMLAIICQTIKGRRGVEAVRSNLARHVGALLRMEKVDPEAWKEFLRRPPEDWLHIIIDTESHRWMGTIPCRKQSGMPFRILRWKVCMRRYKRCLDVILSTTSNESGMRGKS